MSIPKRRNSGVNLIFVLLLVAIVLYLAIRGTQTQVKRYQIADLPCKIVLLADLHSGDLDISLIAKEKPELILIVGDIINSSDTDLNPAKLVLKDLADIAPVYISLGNHELAYENRTENDLSELWENSNVKKLDFTYEDIVINGSSMRIGGVYGYCLPERYKSTNTTEVSFLREFENTDSYKILLDHLPYSWSHYGITADYDIDLVCSGHTHGGQVLLPFVGGLYEQEFGWFPGKMHGKFESNGTTVIVSKGISSAKERIPRINNPGEIVVIEGLTYE